MIGSVQGLSGAPSADAVGASAGWSDAGSASSFDNAISAAMAQGQAPFALDRMTGNQRSSEGLIQLAQASGAVTADALARSPAPGNTTVDWGRFGFNTDTTRGLGYQNARGAVPPPQQTTGIGSSIARGLGWVGGGLLLNETLQQAVGPAPVRMSERAITDDLAVRVYGQTYDGPQAGTAAFTHGVGGEVIDVPVQVSERGLTFDARALEEAYGKPLPPPLAPARDPEPRVAIPPQDMTEVGQRRRDDSCAPAGTQGDWVVVNRSSMSEAAQDYQRQITRTPDLPGKLMLEYRVTNPARGEHVTMDGCAVWSPNRELLEAKHGYGDLFAAGERYNFVVRAKGEMIEEARRQANVIGTAHPVRWHVSEDAALPIIEDAVIQGTGRAPNFSVQPTLPH